MSLNKEVTHEGDGYRVGKSGRGVELQATTRGVDAMPPHWVGECTRHRVQRLNLDGTGIRELPEGLTGCLDLVELSLGVNGLVEIPSTVPKLTRLRRLYLQRNRLERVTEDIGHLLNLEVLILTGNQSLAQLPPKVGHSWKKLRFLGCGNSGLPWAGEQVLTGFRLRELQLAEHGAQALPTHQSGEPAIDSLVIYCDQDREIVTTKLKDGATKGLYSNISLCGQLERQGHHCCTPASDLDCIWLGLQNCKAVVVCLSDSLPLAILSEVLQSQKPIMAVKLYQQALPQKIEEQLSGLKAQGFLVEYQEDNIIDVISQKLAELIKEPAEIQARGPHAIKVFQQATEGGVVRDQRFRVICVGMERVGKTSLIKILTGESFDPNERITHLIDIVKAKSYNSVGAWEVYQTEDGKIHTGQEYHLASEIAKKIKEEMSKMTENRQKKPQMPKREDGSSVAQSNMEPPTTDPTRPELPEVPESFIRLVQELLEKDHDTLQESLREIHLWDFGGQQLYYSLHKVFLSSVAIFLVVFDLSKDMSDAATEWVEDGLSNGQVLEFWLDSIYAYTQRSQPLSVLLVGTHASQVDQDQISTAAKYIQEMLKEKPYRKNIVKEKFEDMFYTVENSCEFADNFEAQRLKRYIEETLIPGILEKRENRPLRWLQFEKKMKTLQTDENQDKQFASLDDVKELAVQCKVIPERDDVETLMTVLQSLHDIGSIIYYGAEDTAMRDLIILKPEWLLEVFRRLIIVPRPMEMNFQFEDSWTKLKDQHILDQPLLESALGYLQDTKSSIIHLLMKYDFLCERASEGEGTAYYVPFVLVQGEGELPDISKRQPSKISASDNHLIFIIDFYRFLPAGVFHQLAVKTLRWSEDCRGAAGRSHEPQIYFRYLAAPLESQHNVSLEWMAQHQIRVVIKKISLDCQDPPAEPAVSNKILKFLERSLVELEKMGLKSVKYDIWVDLEDYPSCSSKCGCRPRLRLNDCLQTECGAVRCPHHLDSLIDVAHIQKSFNAHCHTDPSALYHQQQPLTPPSYQATGQLAAGYQQPLQPPVTPSYQVWAGQHHPPSQPPFSAAASHPHQWPYHPGQPQPPPAASGQTPLSRSPTTTPHPQPHPLAWELSDVFLLGLSKDLGANWEKVGFYLGMRQPVIDRAKANHQFDMTIQAHSLLIQWRQQTPSEHNKRQLLATALEQAGCIEIAEKHSLV